MRRSPSARSTPNSRSSSRRAWNRSRSWPVTISVKPPRSCPSPSCSVPIRVPVSSVAGRFASTQRVVASSTRVSPWSQRYTASAGKRPSSPARSARIPAAPDTRLATSQARVTATMLCPVSRATRCRKEAPISPNRSLTSSVATISRRRRCSRRHSIPAASTASSGKYPCRYGSVAGSSGSAEASSAALAASFA